MIVKGDPKRVKAYREKKDGALVKASRRHKAEDQRKAAANKAEVK